MEHYTYLMVNLGAFLVPFLFSFHPRLRFDKTWYAFFPSCLLTAFFFIAWDVWFTDMKIWGFTNRYLIGIDWLNLPMEEWLFFFCIPYACVYTYHCLKVLISKDLIAPYSQKITYSLAIILLIIGFLHFNKWYTATTFLLTSILLSITCYLKPTYMGRFYLGFMAILPFFFLTNGILTGSGLEEQVVWYNDNENMGIRLGTIPVEDSIYGLLLILLNVMGYEYFLASSKKSGSEMD